MRKEHAFVAFEGQLALGNPVSIANIELLALCGRPVSYDPKQLDFNGSCKRCEKHYERIMKEARGRNKNAQD